LELKLDDLTKEALVLKSLSLDSASTIELTSRAVRHLLKGKHRLSVPRSGQKPEALALEGPSSLSEQELLVEGALAETPQGSTSSPDKRIWIPSALEKSTSQGALRRATSESTNSSLDIEESGLEETNAFDWETEEVLARVTVSSRTALAEDAVFHARLDRVQSVLKENDSPLDKEVTYVNGEGSSSSEDP
jgi:hypothetical protein